MEDGKMTNEIKELLEKIGQDDIFKKYQLYFIGGTALCVYLDHRISYDIDIASVGKLPTNAIKAFAFQLKNAQQINDQAIATAFKINKGEKLENYHLKYMVDGIKLEFSYFDDELRQSILSAAAAKAYNDKSKLKILPLEDIITLKAIALFGRQKSRDLFDMAIILERNLISIDELERIYSFKQRGNITLREYIEKFDPNIGDESDSSLDFLPNHEHYKTFAKLSQDERFYKAKEMFLEQYENKLKNKLHEKQKDVKLSLKKKMKR